MRRSRVATPAAVALLVAVILSSVTGGATMLLPGGAAAAAGGGGSPRFRAGRVDFTIGQTVYRLDRDYLVMDAAPFVSGGRTFVPLRYMGDAMGADVAWDGRTKRVTLTRGDTRVELSVGRPVIRVNGREQSLDVAPVLSGGRTYLPARFVAEAFGYSADWDAATRTVTLRARYTYSRDWLDQRSIWVFGQPPLQYLAAVGATGTMWSVFFSGRNDWDERYLQSLHANGFKVAANFSTAQGTTTVGADQALVDAAACRDVHGRPIDFGAGVPIYLACHNNPDWRLFLQKRVVDQVQGGPDVILIDETAGNATRLDVACLCEWCLKGFRDYLAGRYSAAELRTRFGIADIATYDYAAYLRSVGASGPAWDPNPELRREFFRFQLGTRLDQLRSLKQAAQQAAGQPSQQAAGQTAQPGAGQTAGGSPAGGAGTAGASLLWSANLYNFQPIQQVFVDLVDIIPFEMPIERLPAGKCVPTYLLARAAAPGKVLVGFPDIFVLAQHSPADNVLWSHWLAEAWAAGVSFLLPYQAFTAGGGSFTLPSEAIADTAAFLRANAAYYDYEGAEPVARVAVLWDLGKALYDWEDPAAQNFAGIGRNLYEAHIPYKVVFTGDGDLVPRQLKLEDLEGCDLLVVPRGYGQAPGTVAVLDAYQARGGRVVREATAATVVAAVTGAAGSAVGGSAGGTVGAGGPDLGLDTDAGPDVGVLVWQRGDSLVVHLINYAYDYQAHAFQRRGPFSLTVTPPPGVDLAGRTLRLLSPGRPAATLDYTVSGGKVTFTVPELDVYALLAFE